MPEDQKQYVCGDNLLYILIYYSNIYSDINLVKLALPYSLYNYYYVRTERERKKVIIIIYKINNRIREKER